LVFLLDKLGMDEFIKLKVLFNLTDFEQIMSNASKNSLLHSSFEYKNVISAAIIKPISSLSGMKTKKYN
jgi:hypothetical protein